MEDVGFSVTSYVPNCICVKAMIIGADWTFYFLEKQSWATEEAKQSWQTLAHERTHINIYLNAYNNASSFSVDVCAETFNKAKKDALTALRAEIKDENKRVWQQQQTRNLTFDVDTSHGLDLMEEEKWEEEIYSEMVW